MQNNNMQNNNMQNNNMQNNNMQNNNIQNNNIQNNNICWLSLDPRNNKIDYYPLNIALELEKTFLERNPLVYNKCVLGEKFYNATIHFEPFQDIFQTTNTTKDFKMPGYRSVKRYEINSNKIELYTKCINGEWRIITKYSPNNYDTYDKMLCDEIPNHLIILNNSK